eukprot:TRINITY_DN5050_c0_g1_i1.p2 TRINITY_DN5050_c0_g1~~TRINITY_DN5050_c0_g1_i1.p2  ORF type:complete len:74 (+),score=2.69 TRINITY_DN5050_c0_g1_i1:293-514(+)
MALTLVCTSEEKCEKSARLPRETTSQSRFMSKNDVTPVRKCQIYFAISYSVPDKSPDLPTMPPKQIIPYLTWI